MKREAAVVLAGFLLLLGFSRQVFAEAWVESPTPYTVLGEQVLATPVLDPFDFCAVLRAFYPGEKPATPENFAAIWEEIAQQDAAPAEELPKGWRLFRTALRARMAGERKEQVHAAADLYAEIVESEPSVERACGRLELARLAVILGRFPEAAAQARKAQEEFATFDGFADQRDAARFMRAEAFYFDGKHTGLAAFYAELEKVPVPRIARAARLRLLDLRFDRGERARLNGAYAAAVQRAIGSHGLEWQWGARLAEVAVAGGELEQAQAWLQKFRLAMAWSPERGVAMIREADLLVGLSRWEESEALLSEVFEKTAGQPVGWLAELRLMAYGFGKGGRDQYLKRLQEIGEAQHPALSQYARGVLAHEWTEAGKLDAALALLMRLVGEGVSASLTPNLISDIDRTSTLAARLAESSEGCLPLLQRLGGARAALMRRATVLDAFFAVGACYLESGLPEASAAYYREIVRDRGSEVAAKVALPLARAAFALGDLRLAGASARAQVKRSDAETPAWKLLLAQVELAQGRMKPAIELVLPLVESAALGEEHVLAVATLARAAARLPRGEQYKELLRRELEAVPAAERWRWSEDFGEAAVVAADFYRLAGKLETALTLYGAALELFPDGYFRAEAAYWSGDLMNSESEVRWSWEQAAVVKNGHLFGRLADTQLRVMEVRRLLGLPVVPSLSEEVTSGE